MKNFIISAIMLAASVTAMGQEQFSLKGKVDDTFNGQKAYIAESGRRGAKIDSVTISDGKFSMKNVQFTTPRMVRFFIGDGKKVATDFILEDAQLALTCVPDEEGFSSYVEGSKLNDIYTELNKKLQAVLKKLHVLYAEKRKGEMTEARKAEWEKEYNATDEQYGRIEQEYMVKNADNFIGFYYLQFRYYGMEVGLVKSIYEKWSQEYKDTPVGKRLATWIERQEKTAIGMTFTDFTMKDPDGKDVKLSDYAGKGKYVFVDFWASWCGPCRAEIPNVVKAYSEYKNKGLEIVGVSLDDKEDAWKKAIKDLGATWPQMSDLKGWKCEGAELYGISSIPATVLLDPNGKIIARNLRGENLGKKLAEYLK